MTITPVPTTDVSNYVASPDGTKSTTAVVVAINPDGSSLVGTALLPIISKDYSPASADWSYAAAAGGIANSAAAVTIKTAAGAGVINYLTRLDVSTDGVLATATEIAVRNGSAGPVLWRIKINTTGLQTGMSVTFVNPLKSSANTLLEVVGLTASATGLIYINAGGYAA